MTKGPLKWHGGKAYLAKKIVALMPPHIHYVEPYFGGGAVLLTKNPEGISEVVNDLNGDLTNFWRVLQGKSSFRQFKRFVQAIPFSQVEFSDCLANSVLSADGYGVTVHRAVTFFVRCRQSLAGRMKGFTGITKTRIRRGMNNEVSAWLTAVKGLPAVHARLKRVLIVGPKPAVEVIQTQDGKETLFYCDPPYLHETRASTSDYLHEMGKQHHRELLGVLAGIKGKFLLSGYPSKLYDNTAAKYGWYCHRFDLPNHAAGGKEKRRMIECVWCNF